MSSIGIVLALVVGLKDGLYWMSVFNINPSWNTEHGSSSTGYLSSYGLRFMTICRNSLCRVCLLFWSMSSMSPAYLPMFRYFKADIESTVVLNCASIASAGVSLGLTMTRLHSWVRSSRYL